MSIPETVPKTAAGYIEYLADSINIADKLWTHYAWATSSAYATAYKQNLEVLGKVKKKQQQRRAETEAAMAFVLSLLTVGLAGGVAGALARKFASKAYGGSKVAEDVAKDVLKWSQQQAAAPLVRAVSSAFSPDVASADVFSPADTTPEEYTTSLQEGITLSVGALTQIVFEAKWEPGKKTASLGDKVIQLKSGGQLTTEGARQLTEAILDSSFMKELPPLDIDVRTLTRKAKLALWIGWALARDADYWNRKDAPLMNYIYDAQKGLVPLPVGPAFWEQMDWEPVRQAIIDVGVMYQAVTAQSNMPVGGGQFQTQKGLYMWGFMNWASSPDALAAIFDGAIPKNANGFDMVAKKQLVRQLTPDGWRGANFTPVMTTQ
jgi:hypothetical protein